MMTDRACVKVTDWDRRGFDNFLAMVAPKVARLDGEWDGYEYERPHPTKRGETLWEVAVYFDREKVRPSWVHGWACDAGYVACVAQ